MFSMNYVVREHKKVIQRLDEPVEQVTAEVEVTTESVVGEKEKEKEKDKVKLE
jgi:hypothetical protein